MRSDFLPFFPGKCRDLFVRSLLFRWVCFVIIVVLLLLSPLAISLALASPRQTSSVPTQQDLAKAGVSVVRLLVSYAPSGQTTQKGAPTITQQCTGLGVLVGSGVTAGQQENWVLTDADLLETGNATCVRSTQPNVSVSSVELFMSSAYNSSQLSTPIATLQAADLKGATHTQNNLELFSFRSSSIKLLPYIDVAQADPAFDAAIYLSNGVSTEVAVPTPAISGANQVAGFRPQMLQYLTPVRKAVVSTQDLAKSPKEAGLPLVNGIGQLSGVVLVNGTVVNSQDIEKFLQSIPTLKNPPDNIVHDDWNSGITNYYAGIANSGIARQNSLAEAQKAFTDAFQKNNQFEGAQLFAGAAQATALQAISPVKASPTSTPTQNPLSSLLAGGQVGGVPLWLISVVCLLLLIAIVMVFSLILRRSRARKQWLQDEVAGANRQASLTAQRIQKEEQQQQQRKEEQPTGRAQLQANPSLLRSEVPASPPSIIPELRCPNCGEPVAKRATRCPNCQFWLSPSDADLPYPLTTPRMAEKPIAATDTPLDPLYSGSVRDASLMKEPIQQLRPDPAIPDSIKIPVSKEPERVISSPSRSIGETGRIGQRLGNYRLVRGLGHGGFADVYLGEHVFLKTQAAIKVLHTRLTKEALIDFLKEARTIAELIHPHIVRMLEFGVEGDEPDLEQSVFDAEGCIPYLIMDYASGGTLRKRHPKGTRLSLPTIVPYVRHVADALQYAHDKRLIHRDIKPENMLVGQNNEVLLSDFGIAAVAHSERSMSTQEMAGTVPYMAPEQIRGKPRLASDQYALAIVIYEWLCGVRPFQGSQWEIIDQQLTAFPLPMYKRGISISPGVEAIIMKAMAKDPLQRFDSIRAFAQAFEQASSSYEEK